MIKLVTMSLSEVLSGIAIVMSAVAVWYARRSAKAAEDSAETSREALAFKRQSSTAERSERREQRLSTLAQQAVAAWHLNGSLVPVLDRETDLSPADQDDLARRVYRALGKSEKRGLQAVAQWRETRAKK